MTEQPIKVAGLKGGPGAHQFDVMERRAPKIEKLLCGMIVIKFDRKSSACCCKRHIA